MKKYLLYSLLGVAALSATSCNEDFNEDVAAPQQWEQEAAITLPTVTAKPVVSIDLATAGDSVKVFTTSDVTMPEGTTITNYRLEMTTETNHKAEIKADDNGKIATAELQTFIENSYGKRPTERLIWTNVYANLMKDGQASFLNLGSIEFKATPAAPQISKNYYLERTVVSKFCTALDVPFFTIVAITFCTTEYLAPVILFYGNVISYSKPSFAISYREYDGKDRIFVNILITVIERHSNTSWVPCTWCTDKVVVL